MTGSDAAALRRDAGRGGHRRAGADRARRPTPLAVVVVVGVLVRAVLVPLTHGQDFVVWDRAAAATLHGINIYAHHPKYPAGPYAYTPLFLDLELLPRWLALHTAVPFLIWGKLPICAADVAVALLIAAELRDRGRSGLRAASATALFFWNPLVLYNGAYYGRFDSLACALLLLALRQLRCGSQRAFWTYGLAVAAKTFPLFGLAVLLRGSRGRRRRLVFTGAVVATVISLPYLFTPAAYLHDLVLHDANKSPQGLSWLATVPSLATRYPATLDIALLAAFLLLSILLTRSDDAVTATAVVLVLFLLCSKVVLEQYLLWPLPFAIVSVVSGSARWWPGAVLVTVLSFVGTTANELFAPWGRAPRFLVAALTLTCLIYLVDAALTTRRRPRRTPQARNLAAPSADATTLSGSRSMQTAVGASLESRPQ